MNHRLPTGTRPIIALMVLLGAICSPSWATTTGKIAGRVVDKASNVPIPGAGVRVEGLRLGGVTDANGHYFIIGVPPGSHNVTASLLGYAPITMTEVRVNIDRTTPLDFSLSETAVEVEGVVVVARREVIQLDVAGSRSTLTTEEILELPAVTTLADAMDREPGVSGTSIRSGLPEETQLTINGHSMTDSRLNTFSTAHIPLTSVQEVQILTSGFNAEYGNARSGIINVVTIDDPRRYWFTLHSVFDPAQKRHWGDAAVYGENTKEYQAFGSEESLTTPLVIWSGTFSRLDTVWGSEGRSGVGGWMRHAGGQDSYADSLNRAKQKREFWRIRHPFTADDYASEHGYTVDLSVGGPVPLVEGLSFTASHRGSHLPYYLRSARQAYNDRTEQLTMTYRLGESAKISVMGMHTAESGIGPSTSLVRGGWTSGAPNISNPNNPNTVRLDGAFNKYALYRWNPVNNRYLLGGVTFTHVLSSRTRYELSFDYQRNDYNLGIWPLRYSFAGVGGHWESGLNPEFADIAHRPSDYSDVFVWDAAKGNNWSSLGTAYSKDSLAAAPWGHQGPDHVFPDENSPKTQLQYNLGAAGTNTDSSTYDSYKLRGFLLSQVSPHHQLKSGFETAISRYTQRVLDRVFDLPRFEWYDKAPISISAYIQDRLEYEGMFLNAGLRLDHFDSRANVYDAGNPYTHIWGKDMAWPYLVDHDLTHWLDTNQVNLVGTSSWYGISEARSRTRLSPRLAISHPLSQSSKVYFNYGHFHTFPATAHVYGYTYGSSSNGASPSPAPELDFPRTIMYELAVEKQLTNGFYSWLFGWRTQPQYLLRLAGYYKDVIRTIGYVRYRAPGMNSRRVPTNKGYEQVRGFELRIQKRIGRFLTGWFQGEMSLRDYGSVGFLEKDKLGKDDERESPYQVTSLAEPAWSWYVNLHTPPGFSPYGIPAIVAEEWALMLNMSFSQGELRTYNPAAEWPPPPLNVRTRDTWTSGLAVEKGLSYGRAKATVSLTVSNIFGYKSVSQFGMTSGEWDDYMKSLHFPIRDVTIETWRDENGNPGNDRIGDYPDYAVLPDHDEWALFLNPRMYSLAFRVSF